MKAFISTAMLSAVTLASGAIPANKVCVSNMGGYDLYFWFEDLITGSASAHSSTYPID